MSAIIISDLHLGSRFCEHEQLGKWLLALPDGTDLVLNGDVVHSIRPGFREEHLELLDVLKRVAATRRVVWVAGNHDPECAMPEPGRIEFKQLHNIGEHLLVTHGHTFEVHNFVTGICFSMFRYLYRLQLRLGGPQMHVARYARSFPLLFRVFKNGISANAVRFAKDRGCNTIVCGHTHYAEERLLDGVRYINTGSWTEKPIHCLFTDGTTTELRKLDGIET